MTKFEVGKTYWTTSACDHTCVYSFEILKRTAKTVTVNVRGKESRRGIQVWDDVEQFKPFGTYSMCPVIRATRVREE